MQLYYETRNLPPTPPATLAADIARHLEQRQYLGTALVVCDNPTAALSAVRKQWLKATRYLQRLRASTLNPEEILRLTHAIMHMQNMDFVIKSPLDRPRASVFFLAPEQIDILPPGCFSVYITSAPTVEVCQKFMQKLPAKSLIIDYSSGLQPAVLGLRPKIVLEQDIITEWRQLCEFLRQHNVDADRLVIGSTLQFNAMDEALDTLLDVSSDFLQRAADFQHRLNLGQPFSTISNQLQKKFEVITRLAHRVQALTPGNFNQYLVNSFGDLGAEMYFLRDVGSELYIEMEAATSLALAT